ncbi:MAG: hypothetical protein JXJ04_13830 [Spirochaetales bacterium]|nr:hypothetical protein [Spirochaetales bacterium]
MHMPPLFGPVIRYPLIHSSTVERGTYFINSIRWQAGRTERDSNWATVYLDSNYQGMQTILIQGASRNEESSVTVRSRSAMRKVYFLF